MSVHALASATGDHAELFHFVASLAGCANFIGKTVLGVVVMMWVRWTLPRLRIDQVITTCLKYCVPLVAVCFLGALAIEVKLIPWVSPNDLGGEPPGIHREAWVEQAPPTAADKPSETASTAREGGEG